MDEIKNNIDPRPKHRKDKDNPYEIFTVGAGTDYVHYYISFIDVQGVKICQEVTKEVYEVFEQSELDDLVHGNNVSRYHEQSELTEATLNRRAVNKPKTVEEMVEERELARNVYRIVGSLPKIQYRRFVLYYQTDTSFEEIAKKENCSSSTIRDCVNCAKRRFKKYFQK